VLWFQILVLLQLFPSSKLLVRTVTQHGTAKGVIVGTTVTIMAAVVAHRTVAGEQIGLYRHTSLGMHLAGRRSILRDYNSEYRSQRCRGVLIYDIRCK
jgi:hypothetical protein